MYKGKDSPSTIFLVDHGKQKNYIAVLLFHIRCALLLYCIHFAAYLSLSAYKSVISSPLIRFAAALLGSETTLWELGLIYLYCLLNCIMRALVVKRIQRKKRLDAWRARADSIFD